MEPNFVSEIHPYTRETDIHHSPVSWLMIPCLRFCDIGHWWSLYTDQLFPWYCIQFLSYNSHFQPQKQQWNANKRHNLVHSSSTLGKVIKMWYTKHKGAPAFLTPLRSSVSKHAAGVHCESKTQKYLNTFKNIIPLPAWSRLLRGKSEDDLIFILV